MAAVGRYSHAFNSYLLNPSGAGNCSNIVYYSQAVRPSLNLSLTKVIEALNKVSDDEQLNEEATLTLNSATPSVAGNFETEKAIYYTKTQTDSIGSAKEVQYRLGTPWRASDLILNCDTKGAQLFARVTQRVNLFYFCACKKFIFKPPLT